MRTDSIQRTPLELVRLLRVNPCARHAGKERVWPGGRDEVRTALLGMTLAASVEVKVSAGRLHLSPWVRTPEACEVAESGLRRNPAATTPGAGPEDLGEIREMVKAECEYLKTHTVLQTLLYMNSDAKVAHDVGFSYLEARYGEPGDYAGLCASSLADCPVALA